jgi:2-keto-4-pentenoate hydratase/2-oxohepta-3-ene-1,7-dioic acid hydratase in catechol pathway
LFRDVDILSALRNGRLERIRAMPTTLARSEPFLAGVRDVVLTGTPVGAGFARDPNVFLRPSDEYELRIEGIGSLLDRFVAERVA